MRRPRLRKASIILWRAMARSQGPKGASSSQPLPLEMNGKQVFLHNILGVGIGHSAGQGPGVRGTKALASAASSKRR